MLHPNCPEHLHVAVHELQYSDRKQVARVDVVLDNEGPAGRRIEKTGLMAEHCNPQCNSSVTREVHVVACQYMDNVCGELGIQWRVVLGMSSARCITGAVIPNRAHVRRFLTNACAQADGELVRF